MEHGRRAMIFGEEALEYERLRPSYPNQVVDLLVEGAPDLAVDAGCGTGKAARLVAERGVEVLGVEPDERMAEVARSFGLRVEVASLETWTPVSCDVLYAAQAWHWVDPEAGARTAAEALRPGGRWAAFWNRETSQELRERFTGVYQRLAPQVIDDHPAGGDHEMAAGIESGLAACGAFGPVERASFDWAEELSAVDLVDRRLTHSALRLLDDETTRALRADLLDALGGPEARVVEEVQTFVLFAERR